MYSLSRRCRLRLIAGSFCGGSLRSFGRGTLGGFLGTAGSLFRLTLCHLLGTLGCFLLSTRLLLDALHFGFLLTTRGFFGLALHGSGLSLLANTFSGGGLFGGQALLLCCHLLLLLRGDRRGLLACFFSLGCGLFGGQALLLLRCHLLLLLRGNRRSVLACLFNLGGCFSGSHALLLSGHLLLLLRGDRRGLLASFFSLSDCLFSGLFLCHGPLLQFPLLALIHGGGLSLLCRSTQAGLFGGCVGGPLIIRHFFCSHRGL